MRVVTLVPWRGGDRVREQNFWAVRPALEALGYPLYTGDSVGPWARAQACNTAAAAAGGWDVALIADADTFLEAQAVRYAIARVRRTRGAARPHDKRWMLHRHASVVVVRQGIEALRPAEHLRSTAPGGGALVVHREAWERVGGYDEAYIEWGYEDSAFNIELAVHAGWEIVAGNAYHLWHPAVSLRSPSAKANRHLLEEQRERYARELAARSAAAGYDLNGVL